MIEGLMTLVGGVIAVVVALDIMYGVKDNRESNKRFKEQNKHKNRKIKKKGGK